MVKNLCDFSIKHSCFCLICHSFHFVQPDLMYCWSHSEPVYLTSDAAPPKLTVASWQPLQAENDDTETDEPRAKPVSDNGNHVYADYFSINLSLAQ